MLADDCALWCSVINDNTFSIDFEASITGISGVDKVYDPVLDISYLPTPEWPSDHKALSALFEEIPE